MKIAINLKLTSGPYGGGNQFGNILANHLRGLGHGVVFNLDDPDIDLILLGEPRGHLKVCGFTPDEIVSYKRLNPTCVVVHRVNECDWRKNTRHVDYQLIRANEIADHTVFISGWLQSEFSRRYPKSFLPSTVIHNGSDRGTFQWKQRSVTALGRKIRIVTHHFSSNWMKGWDYYRALDDLLTDPVYADRFEFHYIGQAPREHGCKNIIFHPPLSGAALAAALSKNDVYITGSINEPCGNHQLEAGCLGLPLLYRPSGALTETCRDYGVPVATKEELAAALEELLKNYDALNARQESFQFTSETMCKNYLRLFEDLLHRRPIKASGAIASLGQRLRFKAEGVYFRVLYRFGNE